ncbi:hypothetical protein BD626DRAFT_527084 [Schizophyllum amplum]|uniref:Uncharacterized protein n=1 Tax=Schizophyllum amplum TaxID=97359 RepID=A0A550BSB3_9AGAR|nr:hypothetical protein BD626DRAFT_527084 [Auriculariopsis ampla]
MFYALGLCVCVGRALLYCLFRTFFDHLALHSTRSRISMDDTRLIRPVQVIPTSLKTPSTGRATATSLPVELLKAEQT